MSIGARIKEERERLGYSQTQFAAAVEVSKKTQIRWEQEGGAFPDASQLATWGELGLDMLFVLTGERSKAATSTHLPADEQVLIEAYRDMPAPTRKALLASLLTGGKSPKKAKLEPDAGIKVSGTGHRVAGHTFNERKG